MPDSFWNADALVIGARPVESTTIWTVDDVRNALVDHEAGRFHASARLLDACGRDDRMRACMGTRVNALASKSGLPFSVEPSDEGDQRRAKTVAQVASGQFWRAHDEATLGRVLRDGDGIGAALGAIEWVQYDRYQMPRLHMLHAANLHYDMQRGAWLYSTDRGNIEVTPGDGRWFLYTPGGELDPWMHGSIRALGVLYVMRALALADWARWSERYGFPTLLVKIPAPVEGADDQRRERDEYLRAIANAGREAILEVPLARFEGERDHAIEALPIGESATGFREFIERLDLSVSVLLLGQNLSTEVQGGSYAAANAHERVRRDYLQADAERLRTALREQIWSHWAALNFGDARLAPWPTWDLAPPEDKRGKAETFRIFIDGLAAMKTLGVPVDVGAAAINVRAFAESFGLPLLSDRERAALEAKLAPPPELPPAGREVPALPPGGAAEPLEEAPEQTHVLAARVERAGLREGQRYIDAVADKAITDSRKAIAPDVKAVLAAIEGATTYDEIKARILVAYDGMSPERLAKLTEKAIVLSRLAGRDAVLRDL